jgi:hypothetical protein
MRRRESTGRLGASASASRAWPPGGGPRALGGGQPGPRHRAGDYQQGGRATSEQRSWAAKEQGRLLPLMECLVPRPNHAKTGPMYCNDTKDQFAELRAKGVSLSRIASDLRVPGAAWCGIWPLWSVGPRGFGWTGCWASTVSGGIMRVEVGRKPFRGAAARDGAGERREDRGGRVEAVRTLRRGCNWAVPEVRTRGSTGGCGTVQRRNA